MNGARSCRHDVRRKGGRQGIGRGNGEGGRRGIGGRTDWARGADEEGRGAICPTLLTHCDGHAGAVTTRDAVTPTALLRRRSTRDAEATPRDAVTPRAPLRHCSGCTAPGLPDVGPPLAYTFLSSLAPFPSASSSFHIHPPPAASAQARVRELWVSIPTVLKKPSTMCRSSSTHLS